MDPITGIGLTASVVQLVEFGISAARTCQQIYQDGSTSENANAEYVADQLASLTRSLQQSLKDAKTNSALSKDEKELVDLGRKCEDCANELLHELQKLRARPHASALETVRIAVRSIRKKNSIVKIQNQLSEYTKTLETSLLYRINKRFDAQSLCNNENFINLIQGQQHIIKRLAESQTNIVTLVAHESMQTRQHINERSDQLKDRRVYDEVIRSLFYPEITARQEQIEGEFDGIQNTCDWIFDQSHKKQTWSNFSEWLKSGNAVYWINGKAGSGKSTLMSYICDHNRKDELLKQWSGDRRLLTPTFFFWNAGTSLQKTINGLLRSIIFQILTECRELIVCFKNESLHTWNEPRLLARLVALLTQERIPLAICMFIDGLDEFEGRYDAVIEAIGNLSKQAHVKICLSSRPLLNFARAFTGMTKLNLQDMTFDSIRAYVNSRLLDPIQQRFTADSNSQARAENLLNDIVERADGVYLWVVIAVRDVRDGLQDFADLDELARAVEELPASVDSLYTKMLDKIKPPYRRDAARFLQIVLYSDFQVTLDLYRLYFINRQKHVFEDLPFDYEKIDQHDLVQACQDLKIQLLSHTVGLLDLTTTESLRMPYTEEDDYEPILLTRVQFHHRTVRDFLFNNTAAQAFLAAYGVLKQHVHLFIARGTFAHFIHISQREGELLNHYNVYWSTYMPLSSIMLNISMVERLVGASQRKFLRSLHEYSLVPYHRISTDTDFDLRYIIGSPYIIDLSRGWIELVGLAVQCGVERYVCEVLDLSFVEPVGLSDSMVIHAKANYETALVWVPSMSYQLNRLDYREWLNECLKWKTNDQVQADKNGLAETYLLACLNPILIRATKSILIRILLQAGANPMVRVGRNLEREDLPKFCFWGRWLFYLRYLESNLNDIDGNHSRASLDDIWKTTKYCIAQGANINYVEEDFLDIPVKEANLQPKINIDCTAMFWLEKRFHHLPEFQEFAAAIEPTVVRPLRRISFSHGERVRVYPTYEESEMLWPLIDKWERTAYPDDLEKVQSAMDWVWKAHRPEGNENLIGKIDEKMLEKSDEDEM